MDAAGESGVWRQEVAANTGKVPAELLVKCMQGAHRVTGCRQTEAPLDSEAEVQPACRQKSGLLIFACLLHCSLSMTVFNTIVFNFQKVIFPANLYDFVL